ncbi:hypothetical protein K7432_009783 [Basidiobolus ranarum]|uniref:ZZ-type zinc finger-containing protein 3 n=1 Tax=Basidiobolus ranarum TaxID=34480 RepID=A0ABR2WPS5_9FUNG
MISFLLVTSAMDVLKHQLNQARKDIDRLVELKEKALTDPLSFVTRLGEKDTEKPPKLQRVVAIPTIELDKYISRVKRGTQDITLNFPPLKRPSLYKSILSNPPTASTSTSKVSSFVSCETRTSHKANIKQEESDEFIPETEVFLSEIGSPKSDFSTKKKVNNGDKLTQSWDDEEQRRLIILLNEYPEELVQSQRFSKISTALGTKTPKQVASRVQKYFVQLAKAGLPVPGRVSNTVVDKQAPLSSARKFLERDQTPSPKKQKVASNSGYLSRCTVPISPATISDDDAAAQVPSTWTPPAARKSTPKTSPEAIPSAYSQHGYKCDRCLIEPIIGSRWVCMNCDHQVDLCNSCHSSGDYQNDHDSSHAFQKLLVSEPTVLL